MGEVKAVNTDDERMTALFGDVRYYRAMATANADNDALCEFYTSRLRDALDALRHVALAKAANGNDPPQAVSENGNVQGGSAT